jgi:2-polyprenyl-6-methoxyphenol hydroxylase-like FAD-dependent oxidoreductase
VERAPVLIVGAGPVGMTLALELARLDVPSVLLDSKPHLERTGSRSMVNARHTIETFLRLGCGEKVLAKGVALASARTYFRDIELFCVEFPEAAAGEVPRFLNLQQTYVEEYLYELVAANPKIDVRWGSEVKGLAQDEDGVTLTLRDGGAVGGAYAVGCDGARSIVRELAGVAFPGRSIEDRFLIADVKAELPFPHERRFFFDPPHNPGRQVLIHPQPDSEWRIDWQVGSETDPGEERASGRLDERIRAIVGDAPYEVAWLTAYRLHERVASHFRVGRLFLAGDAAHLFSVFGARGLNSGIEDARNVGWKLALVLSDEAPEALLDSYEAERRPAALENLRVTSATMRFMAPPTRLHRALRNAILRGSVRSRRARRFVNSGKLAEPAVYGDGDGVVGRLVPHSAPLQDAGRHFGVATLDGEDYLVRPDGYVAAPLSKFASVEAAVASVLQAGPRDRKLAQV